jgi:amino acid transporter
LLPLLGVIAGLAVALVQPVATTARLIGLLLLNVAVLFLVYLWSQPKDPDFTASPIPIFPIVFVQAFSYGNVVVSLRNIFALQFLIALTIFYYTSEEELNGKTAEEKTDK